MCHDVCHVSDVVNAAVLEVKSNGPDGDNDGSLMMQVYGQGMTVSAVEAEALHNLLKVTQLQSIMIEYSHISALYQYPTESLQSPLGKRQERVSRVFSSDMK